jgi:hypothetical protein
MAIAYTLPLATEPSDVSVVWLTVNADGECAMNGDPIAERDLEPRLRDLLARSIPTRAVIAAEAAVPYGHVVALLDLLRKAGVTEILLSAGPSAPRPPPPPAPPPSASPSSEWSCSFPKEAEDAKIDSAVVTLAITVSEAGAAEKISVIDDPGHGFGRAAEQCAREHTFPRKRVTTKLKVRFER